MHCTRFLVAATCIAAWRSALRARALTSLPNLRSKLSSINESDKSTRFGFSDFVSHFCFVAFSDDCVCHRHGTQKTKK